MESVWENGHMLISEGSVYLGIKRLSVHVLLVSNCSLVYVFFQQFH